MLLRRFASVLICFAAGAAPWIAGANTSWLIKGWWLAAPLALSFFLLCAQSLAEKKWPSFPWTASVPVLFLLGCLAGWAAKPELEFPTAFSAEHWRFLETTFPFMIFQWPRAERFMFLASALLGFLAVVDLGSSEKFRRQLCATIGLSGLILALYALGMRWLDWPTLPWINQAADTERFNVAFFHHSGPGACLNLAWPLLVFGSAMHSSHRILSIRNMAIGLVVIAALLLWHSLSAPLIATALLFAGTFLQFLVNSGKIVSPLLIRTLIALAFVAIGTWQWRSLQPLRVASDGWVSAAQTERDALTRDAPIKTAALKRGDRLVASTTPPRPAGWLAAMRMAADYPLIGLGPGSWVKRVVLYSNDTIVNTFYQHRQFAHHDFLQTAAEWGGLGACAWLVLWVGGLWRVTGNISRGFSQEIGVVLALVGIAVHSTVHSPLQNPALLTWALLLLGLTWSTSPRPTQATEID
jgi:hypothetical protein